MVFKSIEKTSVPSLSELSIAIGPIDADDSRTNIKPLCANIFDVQRGELMEEYERLRKAFWSNEVPPSNPQPPPPPSAIPSVIETPVREQTPIQPMAPSITKSPSPLIPQPLPIRKRAISETRSLPVKRLKTNSVQRDDSPQILVKLSPLKAYESLLRLKHMFIQQLKTADGFNEPKLISMLSDVKSTISLEQSQHLAIYLIPVAKATRRDTIIKTLEQWFV